MFCSKCGKKLANQDKFCPKCGQSVSSLPNQTQSATSQPAVPNQTGPTPTTNPAKTSQPAKKTNWCLTCLVFFLVMPLILGILYFTISTPAELADTSMHNAFTFLLFIPLIIIAAWALFTLVRKIAKKYHPKPLIHLIIIALAIALILIPIIILYYSISNKVSEKIAGDYNSIQTSFADAIAAKYLGDDIVSGKSTANFSSVKQITQAAVNNLAKEKTDDKYYNAVYDWAGKINTAAKSKTTWKNLPDPPTNIGETLADNTASIDYQSSLDKVAALKDYGDWAIAKGDKDTMRNLAAQLEAEDVWQNNTSDQSALNTIDQVYAATKTLKIPKASLPRGGCRGFMPCRKKTVPVIHKLFQAARNYSVATAPTPQQWQDAWKDMLNIINIDNGYNLEGTGVIKDGKTTATVSPMEQAFNDECHAKSGTIGGTVGVKDRLPTTLTAGGFNCDYKHNDNVCWDTMTRTGERFMGGETGCPEENLLPKLLPTPTPKKNNPTTPITPTTQNWDGSYTAQEIKPNCDSSVDFTVFQVSGNAVVNLYGKNAPIGSDGRATLVMNSGTITTINLTFRKNGSQINVNGVWSTTRGCSGTIQGQKSNSWF